MITLTIIIAGFLIRKMTRTRLQMARVETSKRIVPARMHEAKTY